MGWASYEEDIIERFSDSFDRAVERINSALTAEEIKTVEDLERLKNAIEAGFDLLRELRDYLDVAIDPRIDMGREIKKLQDKIEILEG